MCYPEADPAAVGCDGAARDGPGGEHYRQHQPHPHRDQLRSQHRGLRHEGQLWLVEGQ